MCLLILIFEALGVCFVFYLKVKLSDVNISEVKIYVGILINSVFIAMYIKIIKHDEFWLLGYRPDIFYDCIFVGWFAFFCIFAHAMAIPVGRKVKWWFSRKNGEWN